MDTVTEEEYLSTLGVIEIWDKHYDYCIIIIEWEKYLELQEVIMYAIFDGMPMEMVVKLIQKLGITHSVIQSGRRNYIDYNMYEGHERIWRFGK